MHRLLFNNGHNKASPIKPMCCAGCAKPKLHLLSHVTTRTTCRAYRAPCDKRVALVVRVAPCLFQRGGQRRSSSARVYKFSLLCPGFASISGRNSGKSEVDMSTLVHAVATPLNKCRASRACHVCRYERVAPCCPQARHSTSRLFRVPKCMG